MNFKLLLAATLVVALSACVPSGPKLPKAAPENAVAINAELPPGSTDAKQDSEGWVTFKNGNRCYTYRRLLDDDGTSNYYITSVFEVDCPKPLTPAT